MDGVPIQCFQRYIRELEMQGSYKKWTDEEDGILLDTVQKTGTKGMESSSKEATWTILGSMSFSLLSSSQTTWKEGKMERDGEVSIVIISLFLWTR